MLTEGQCYYLGFKRLSKYLFSSFDFNPFTSNIYADDILFHLSSPRTNAETKNRLHEINRFRITPKLRAIHHATVFGFA